MKRKWAAFLAKRMWLRNPAGAVGRASLGFACAFVLVFALLLAVAPLVSQSPRYRVIADSVREYSGEQGGHGWSYGYFDMNIADGRFLPMTHRNGTWRADSSRFYTNLSVTGGMPHGLITSGGREQREHWAVRRWRSDYSGRVRISGRVGKFDGRGDGVTVRVDVNGVEVWSQRLGPYALGTNYSFFTEVTDGANVDFIVTPHRSDFADSTIFTAVIEAVE